jgi:drug/metabolite transporter (DMT)-like permease
LIRNGYGMLVKKDKGGTTINAAIETLSAVPRWIAFAALLGGNAALAFGPMFVRFADTGPVAAGFWRLALALPVLFVLAIWQGRSLGQSQSVAQGQSAVQGQSVGQGRESGMVRAILGHPRNSYILLLLAGICFGLDLASWHLGIMLTKAANATLFGNAASLFLVLYGIFLARRLPQGPQALAVVLAFAGGAILMGQSYELDPAHFRGDALSLLAGLLYTGYMIAMQRVRDTMPNWAALALVTLFAAIPALITALLLGEKIMPGDWGPVVALAFTSQLLGQGLLIYALPHFSPLVIGLTLLTQPALAALSGWLAFGERLSWLDVTGGVLVAIALVLVRLPAVLPGPSKAA